MEVDAQTIGEAHDKVIRAILEDGQQIDIEVSPGKMMSTWEYPEPITTIIRRPLKQPMKSEALPYGQGFLDKYLHDLITITPPTPMGFSYTYPNRLFDYPIKSMSAKGTPYPQLMFEGNGTGNGFDQIQALVNKMVTNPDSRRALAITWVPEIDAGSIEPPCLQFVHFMLRKNDFVFDEQFPGQLETNDDICDGYCLSLRAAFRSHDMLLGAGPNWVALAGLQTYVAGMVCGQLGQPIAIDKLVTFSSSAHIYVDSQAEEIKAFKRVLRIS